jgi:hypothetical protein
MSFLPFSSSSCASLRLARKLPGLRIVVGAVAIVSTACALGAPLGFAKGDSWSIPAMGALEDGAFIVPVEIEGKGPFLFVAWPGAKSSIDPGLAKQLGLFVERTDGKLVNAGDHISHEITDYAEIKRLSLGDLTANRRRFIVYPGSGTYKGIPLNGVIGADILDDTLIWTFDRDRQMIHLAVQEKATRPSPDAIEVKLSRVNNNAMFVDARIGERTLDMRVDFIRTATTVWPAVAESLGLPSLDGQQLRDAFGRTYRYDDHAWRVPELALAGAVVGELAVFPLRDKRVRESDFDGELGADFFAQFDVTVNMHKLRMWLRPRQRHLGGTTEARVGRWGPAALACEHLGCVSIELGDAAGSEPAIRFSRDAAAVAMDFDALVEAVDEAGEPLPLPRMMVAFSAGASPVHILKGATAARYGAAAGFRVIDVTPFPPACPGGCAFVME